MASRMLLPASVTVNHPLTERGPGLGETSGQAWAAGRLAFPTLSLTLVLTRPEMAQPCVHRTSGLLSLPAGTPHPP